VAYNFVCLWDGAYPARGIGGKASRSHDVERDEISSKPHRGDVDQRILQNDYGL
jgi:hypothetical protein